MTHDPNGAITLWTLRRLRRALGWLAAIALAASPVGAFDLSRAQPFQLDNGLTVIVLEVPEAPAVSVQMLYRVGARNEEIGETGLTHFLEHMAFRASENFPETGLVSSIYAVGGEWHGYTWLDQTTYFETVPPDALDLALKIEADRMARLRIPAAEVEAERGAVLAEMHGYENDPATVLHDAVMAVAFLQHPYRNNTIGWESDVESIHHDDLVEFYRNAYRPANAVLAVVGPVSAAEVVKRVGELFGDLPGGERTQPPPTVEPPQNGVRRVELLGPAERKYFKIAYHAPAVGDPDYAAFLLVQQVLAGGRGVNFGQNEFGDPVSPASRLAGVSGDLATWYPPQAAPYVFTIAGSIDADASTADLEAQLQAAIDALIAHPPSADELAAARRRLLDELVFDLETTEDAAHQLAYFAGLDALDVLLNLPDRLAAVTEAEISRVAGAYLRPRQRTIGWYLPGPAPAAPNDAAPSAAAPAPAPSPAHPAEPEETNPVASPPRVVRLAGGVPVIFQKSSLSSSAYLRVLVPATNLELGAAATANAPIWRWTSVNYLFRPSQLKATLGEARLALSTATRAPPPSPADVNDPMARLALAFDEALDVKPQPATPGPAVIALVGDLQPTDALPLLESAFGDLTPADTGLPPPTAGPRERRIDLPVPVAQAALGYVVLAPPPSQPEWFAWRMLLYVLSHGYEGRLGVEAISRRGLVYYIDAEYLTDGASGRVSLAIGVDPGKLDAMSALLRESLQGLVERPPTTAEIEEAKSHLLGRRTTAAQSNSEVSAALIEDWVGHGRLVSEEAFEAAVSAVSPEDVEKAVPGFVAGTTIVVRGVE